MRFLFDDDEQVAVNATTPGSIAFASHGQLHALGNTGRDVDGDDLFLLKNPFTVAMRTLVGDDFTFALAVRTNGLGLHPPQNGIGNTGDCSCAPTSVAGGVGGAPFSASTVTVRAGYLFANLDFFLGPFGNFSQIEFHPYT